jgi:hypothetical protein
MLIQRLALLACVATAGVNAWLRKVTGAAVLDTPNGRWVLFGGTVVLAVLLWNLGREKNSRKT